MNSLLSNAQLFELSPLHVDEGERIGFLHEDKAAALGRLMAVDGQRDPIKVVAQPKNEEQPWRLVTGMHRLIGARIEGITIWAIEVSGKPEDLANLEASENLHRRPLAPIERAKFVHALCEAATIRLARGNGKVSWQKAGIQKRWDRVKAGEIRADQALQDEANDSADKMSAVYGWQESAADAFGLDKRSIRRALELYRQLVEPFPDLIEALAQHPVVGDNASQLKDICAVPELPKRRAVIEALIADHELSADAAIVQVGLQRAGRAPSPFEKFSNQITGAWGRFTIEQRRRFIETNINTLFSTPDLIRRAQAQLAARLAEIEEGTDNAR